MELATSIHPEVSFSDTDMPSDKIRVCNWWFFVLYFFFLIAICFRFSFKTLSFPTFFHLSLPALPQCLCCLPERGTPPFNLTSISTQQALQSFSWLLVSHLIRHHTFMLAPCICTRYFVRLSGRTESFQLAYLLVCQTGERGGEKGRGRQRQWELFGVSHLNFSPFPTPVLVLLGISSVHEASALCPE